MYASRPGRLYPDNENPNENQIEGKQLLNPYSIPQNKIQLQEESPPAQTRYFNSSIIQQLISEAKDNKPPICKVEPPEVVDITNVSATTKAQVEPAEAVDVTNVSATTKALDKVEAQETAKRVWKKGVKIPTCVRRKKLNQRLSKLLTPKSGLSLLNELKPDCVYKIHEQPGCFPPSFFAQVEHQNNILGTGQGLSKSQAKNCAAENAIKRIVSKALSQQPSNTNEGNGTIDDTPESLPWAGLASFALYKMFTEWQNQGAELTVNRPPLKKKAKTKNVNKNPPKKLLPPNATERHPTAVLNFMYPGITHVEIEREDGPKCRVKVGYLIDGKMYIGMAGNKKDARKEAAKAALASLYGLTYFS